MPDIQLSYQGQTFEKSCSRQAGRPAGRSRDSGSLNLRIGVGIRLVRTASNVHGVWGCMLVSKASAKGHAPDQYLAQGAAQQPRRASTGPTAQRNRQQKCNRQQQCNSAPVLGEQRQAQHRGAPARRGEGRGADAVTWSPVKPCQSHGALEASPCSTAAQSQPANHVPIHAPRASAPARLLCSTSQPSKPNRPTWSAPPASISQPFRSLPPVLTAMKELPT